MKHFIVSLILLIVAFAVILIYFGSVSYEYEAEGTGCNNSVDAMMHFKNLSYIVAIISVLFWLYGFFKPFAGKFFKGKKTRTIFIWHIMASVLTAGTLMLVFYVTNVSDMRRLILSGLHDDCKELVERYAVFVFRGLPFPFSLIIEGFIFILIITLVVVFLPWGIKKIKR